MFWKKKDKDEAPAPKGKDKADARREEPRREEPRREESRRQEPQRAPAAPAASSAKGPGAAIDAALNAKCGPRGAPVSPESTLAQTRAADALAGSRDAVDKAAARDIAAGDLDKGFEALQGAAQAAGKQGAERWRTLGALAFHVDASRSKAAYESLFTFQPRKFWDGMYLARLRGMGQQLGPAQEAATSALQVAANDEDRANARCELGHIAFANADGSGSVAHAEAAIALGKAATPRDVVVRQMLLGEGALFTKDLTKARAAFAVALDGARRLGTAAPTDTLLARGICEVLERSAAAAAAANDHDAAQKFVDETLNIRRRLGQALPPMEGKLGVTRALNIKGELRRAANDPAGAKAAFDESLGIVRQISEASPRDPAAQREHWGVLWRLASTEAAGVQWAQVVTTMERMGSVGGLDQDGQRFLDEAKRRAAAA